MTLDTKPTLAEALREAYAEPGACSPPEVYLREELAGLAPAERARLESHAESCPACAAERDLARSFEAQEAMSPRESHEVGRIVRRLERRAPGRKSGLARWLGIPSFGGFAGSPAVRVAAAAALVLVVGFAVQSSRTGPPSLPDATIETVTRGSEVAVVSPRGEIEALPGELRWEEIESAAAYRVTLKAVDDTVLWEATGAEAAVSLPESVVAGLHRAVTYFWSVDALDEQGRRIAGSGAVEFRARPAAE